MLLVLLEAKDGRQGMGSTENGKAEPEGDGILSRREAAHEVARAALRDVMERRRLTRQQVADVLIVSLPTVHSWLLPARSGASRTMAPDRLEALQEATAHRGDIPTWPTGDGAHEARRVLLRNLMEERGLGKQGVADALGTSVHIWPVRCAMRPISTRPPE